MASDKQCDDGEDFSVTYEQVDEMNKDDGYKPFLACKSSSHKNVEPTLENRSKHGY